MSETPRVAYLCDRKACNECPKDSPCIRTEDVLHALNFVQVGKNKWVEGLPYPELIRGEWNE